MTKLRPPLTLDAAITRAAALLPGGWSELAELTGRSTSMVRAWADADRREQIPLRDALLIDTAALPHGEAPLFAWYSARIHFPAAAADDAAALIQRAAQVVRECGEACAALAEASHPNVTPAEKTRAHREVEEAIAVLLRCLPQLRAQPP